MHEIESSFGKDRARKLEQRRRKRNRFRFVLAGAGIVVLAAAISVGIWLDRPPATDDSDEDMVQQQVAEVAIPVYVPVIIDLPGDPVHIELGGDGSGERPRQIPAPPALLAQGISGSISILSGNVVESGERLAIALPSTQQDFAFFQSQRSTGPALPPDATAPESAAQNVPEAEPQTEAAAPEPGDLANNAAIEPNTTLDEGGDWGDIDSAGIEGGDQSFEKTAVADNTTTLLLTPERLRAPVTEELIVRVVSEVENERFFIENGINLLDAKRAAISFQTEFGTAKLDAGSLIAMRLLRTGGQGSDRKLVQVAIYLTDQFLGALALSPDNVLQAAADPWANQQLLTKAEQSSAQPAEAVRYRLLDSIFSAGLRKGVPASIVGEAIMYLSRQHDLGDLADPEDRMTIIYGDKPRLGGQSSGRVLYVGVVHQGKAIRCFVYMPEGANDFKCLDENDVTAEIEVSNGIVIPVAGGVLTSGFGPRKHPILKTVLLHKGVDWAAPIGTPVLAAMAGTISFAGDGGSYGNLIKMAHENGRETRYAHLNAFAKTATPGATVAAGDVIGYIGTTGRSTGPHLHFELYLSGQPIDPLVTATASVVASAGGDEGAVEKLVNRIIHVESGGSATAKNPLSTATGLGQFIESTWLRMMRTYRADLANSLSREKLLALRFDPTLSREMVTNLARENKAYLVAGGVQITAGRLYLAHFLGPEGARLTLSSSDSSDLEALLGSGVINANPFLRGKDVTFIKNWAEKKMQGKAYVPQVAKAEVKKESVQKTSPAYALYRKVLLDMAG